MAVNGVSMSRLYFAYNTAQLVSGMNWTKAMLWLLVGVTTDILDGFLARQWKVETPAGFYIDAITDRILLLSPFIGIAMTGEISWLLITGLAVGFISTDYLALRASQPEPRIAFWYICYGIIGYNLWTHVSHRLFWGVLIASAILGMLILYLKRQELKSKWDAYLNRGK